MRYYWIELKGTWGLWRNDGTSKKRVAYVVPSPSGHYVSVLGPGAMWEGNELHFPEVVWVSKSLERAKAKCVVSVRL